MLSMYMCVHDDLIRNKHHIFFLVDADPHAVPKCVPYFFLIFIRCTGRLLASPIIITQRNATIKNPHYITNIFHHWLCVVQLTFVPIGIQSYGSMYNGLATAARRSRTTTTPGIDRSRRTLYALPVRSFFFVEMATVQSVMYAVRWAIIVTR